MNARRADLGLRDVEPGECIGIDGRPELGERHAEREMSGGGREEVAAVERARDGLERVLRVRELVRLGDPAELLGGGHEQAVVGPDVDPAARVAQRERASRRRRRPDRRPRDARPPA